MSDTFQSTGEPNLMFRMELPSCHLTHPTALD